jgi:hypothetical protein
MKYPLLDRKCFDREVIASEITSRLYSVINQAYLEDFEAVAESETMLNKSIRTIEAEQ